MGEPAGGGVGGDDNPLPPPPAEPVPEAHVIPIESTTVSASGTPTVAAGLPSITSSSERRPSPIPAPIERGTIQDRISFRTRLGDFWNRYKKSKEDPIIVKKDWIIKGGGGNLLSYKRGQPKLFSSKWMRKPQSGLYLFEEPKKRKKRKKYGRKTSTRRARTPNWKKIAGI